MRRAATVESRRGAFPGSTPATLVPASSAHPDWMPLGCALDFRFAHVLVGKRVSTFPGHARDFRFAHVLVGKPVSTFPGHGLRQPLSATAMLNRDQGNKQ